MLIECLIVQVMQTNKLNIIIFLLLFFYSNIKIYCQDVFFSINKENEINYYTNSYLLNLKINFEESITMLNANNIKEVNAYGYKNCTINNFYKNESVENIHGYKMIFSFECDTLLRETLKLSKDKMIIQSKYLSSEKSNDIYDFYHFVNVNCIYEINYRGSIIDSIIIKGYSMYEEPDTSKLEYIIYSYYSNGLTKSATKLNRDKDTIISEIYEYDTRQRLTEIIDIYKLHNSYDFTSKFKGKNQFSTKYKYKGKKLYEFNTGILNSVYKFDKKGRAICIKSYSNSDGKNLLTRKQLRDYNDKEGVSINKYYDGSRELQDINLIFYKNNTREYCIYPVHVLGNDEEYYFKSTAIYHDNGLIKRRIVIDRFPLLNNYEPEQNLDITIDFYYQ